MATSDGGLPNQDSASARGSGGGQPSIEELQRRYHDLNEKKIRSETQRDEARKQLVKLQAEAREKYGTDVVAELQTKLDDMVAENARKVGAYKTQLDLIDQGLAEVERKFASSASPPAPSGARQSRR